MDLKQETVAITGANRGIGLALARVMAPVSEHMILLLRKKDHRLEEEIKGLGARQVTTIIADLSDLKATQAAAAQVSSLEPSLLINNAGLLTGGLFESQDADEVVRMLQVNLVSLILLTRKVLPGMLLRKRGKIVNNASVSGKMFLPCASTYAASKAGVVAFTESLRQELKGTGVSTLLMVTPGVKTDMFDEIPNLYFQHLKVKLAASEEPSSWALKVRTAVEIDKDTLWPDSQEKWALGLSRYFPGLFERLVGHRFQREDG